VSNRLAYSIAVLILLAGAFLRMRDLSSLPPGMNAGEITNARIAETIRQGRAEIFYAVAGEGHEGGFPALITAFTTVAGGGVFTMRMLAVLGGMLALAAVYALGKRLYGAPSGVAAMALMAVSMLPIILSRAITAEAFTPFLTAMTLLLLAKAFPIFGRPPLQEPGVTTFAMLAGLLGVSFYITPSAFVLVLTTVIFIAYLVLSRQPLSRRTLSYTWFALVLLIVMATPYLIATLQNPAMSGAARVFDETVVSPLQSLIRGLGGILFVGDPDALWNLPERPLLDLVSGLLMLVGLYVSLRGWRQPRFMLVLIALVLTMLPAMLSGSSPGFLRFAALLPLLIVLFGLGVTALYRGLHATEARIVTGVALAGLMIFNIQWTTRDLYTNWPRLDVTADAYSARIGTLARYIDANGSVPTVVCTTTLRLPQSPASLSDAQLLLLMLHQQEAPLRYVNCAEGLVFPNAGGRFAVVFLQENGLEQSPQLIRQWLARGTIVPVPALPDASVIVLDVAEPLASTLGTFTTTAPVSFPPESPGGMETIGPPVRFGGNLSFMGYVRNWTASLRPMDIVQVPTYWRVDGQLPADVTLFTHIQSDPASVPVAQTDRIGVLPESLLPRDIFMQITMVPLPITLPAGLYSLSTGAYEQNSAVRLPVYDGDAVRGNRIFIGEITVLDR